MPKVRTTVHYSYRHSRTFKNASTGFILFVFVVFQQLYFTSGNAAAASPFSITVSGYVKNMVSGAPIPGAAVSVPTQGVSLTSGTLGNLPEKTLLLPEGTKQIAITINATGYKEEKSIIDVFPGARIQVTGQLVASSNISKVVVNSDAAKLGATAPSGGYAAASTSPIRKVTLSGSSTFKAQSDTQTVLPPTIKVWRVALNRVDVVPFDYYVKHVVPHEWFASWPMDSLKTGAMCAKTYAWYWVLSSLKYENGADVRDDTYDQTYDPSWSNVNSDMAVDDTWNYVMTRDGSIFMSQYCAGTYAAGYDADFPGRLTQWGSCYWADLGKDWQWILHYYYGPTLGYWDSDIAIADNTSNDSSSDNAAPKNQLSAHESLKPGNALFSLDGRFRLAYQGDGNLVLYRTRDGAALWNSKTNGSTGGMTVMQGDGNAVVYNASGVCKWASWTQGHPGSRLVVQNDGNVVVYDPSNKPLWATWTQGRY